MTLHYRCIVVVLTLRLFLKPVFSRNAGPLYFHIFCLSWASGNKKWHFGSPYAGACRCQSLCEKSSNFPNGWKTMAIFTNWLQKGILTSDFPRPVKTGIWQFLWLDLVITLYTVFYQNIPYGWRSTDIPYFQILCLSLAWGNQKCHLASPVGYISVQ